MPNLDLDKYRVNKAVIVAAVRNSRFDKFKVIGQLSLATYVPIIAVACFVGEEFGFDEELKGFIQRLMKFYDIEKIDNVQEVTWLGKGHPVDCKCDDCVDPEEVKKEE